VSVRDEHEPQQRTHDDDGRSVSTWMADTDAEPIAVLDGALDVEVCVVGAGIAGLSTAYCVARDGLSVAVLEDGTLGGGQTKRTTAHLASALDDRFLEIERVHGVEGARVAAASHAAAIDRIEKIVREEGIDCGFERVDGCLCPAGECGPAWLERERDAARRAGLDDVELVRESPIPALGSPCLRFPRQAQFHPLRYLAGLAAAAERSGARIFGGAHVDAIDPKDDGTIELRTSSGARVTARFVVVATNSPIHERVAVHTKQAPYRTYAMAIAMPAGSVPRALYWDTLDPYHYVRVQPAEREAARERLIVGGEDHRVRPIGEAEAVARWSALESWARKRFPSLEEVTHRWSGQILETVDGLAFVGATPSGPPNLMLASGDSGMGLTHGTIAGILLADGIAGRKNPWAPFYDPSRKPLAAAAAYLRENLESTLCYGEWLKPGSGDPRTLRRGTGAVFGWGTHKRAVYRDVAGKLHVRSALCPHLGGVVGWNDAEKTWDCPCHGSRFDRYGRVVQGPANEDLAEKS
jgi:glycine/D-amino acid oxidase-like deaminating enzyme/nitrite reductase/ring-hydroxylating ferredoxin subunit